MLDRWTENPRRLVLGARMDARFEDAEERRLIIEYLRADGVPSEAPRR
jgi:cytochrome c2